MFSVIIPLYNKSSYVKKAILSVLHQKFQKFELIIINDGSTDNSLEIIEEFCDSRIRIINQSNQGVAVSRNNGVKASRFYYIAFLDADDWWHPDYLLLMNSLIHKFPDAKIFGSKYYRVKNKIFKESLNQEAPTFEGVIDYYDAYMYAWWMPLHPNTTIICRDIFIKLGGFNPKLKFGEDFDLWIRVILHYKLAYINRPLGYFNQDVQANTRALGQKKWKQEEHYIFNLDYLIEAECTNPLLKQLLDGLRVRSLLPFYLRGDFPDDVNKQIIKVDFSRQPVYYRLIYFFPKPLVKAYFSGKGLGSKLKQLLIRLVSKV